MEASERHVEIKVGLFALLAVAVLAAFVLALGRVRMGGGRELWVDFAGVSALQARAPVRLGGIEVGQVQRIALLAPDAAPPPAAPVAALGRCEVARVRVTLRVDAAAEPFLGAGATFALATQGLIGESYLELLPGTAPAATPAAPATAALRGVDAPRLAAMALHAEAVLEAAGALLGSVDAPPGQLGTALGELVGHVNAIVGGRRARIGAAIDDAAAALATARRLADAMGVALGDGAPLHALIGSAGHDAALLEARLPALLARGDAALRALDAVAGKVDGSLDAATLRHILEQGDGATRALQALAADAQAVVRGLRGGQGSAGAFLQDSQIFDDVKELFGDLRQHPWKFFWRD